MHWFVASVLLLLLFLLLLSLSPPSFPCFLTLLAASSSAPAARRGIHTTTTTTMRTLLMIASTRPTKTHLLFASSSFIARPSSSISSSRRWPSLRNFSFPSSTERKTASRPSIGRMRMMMIPPPPPRAATALEEEEEEEDSEQKQQQKQQPSPVSVTSVSPTPPPPLFPRDLPDDSASSTATTTTRTVLEVMQSSIAALKVANIDEPEESVYHLLSFALNLSWESGFRDLRRLLHLSLSSSLSPSSSSTNNDNVFLSLQRRTLTSEEWQAFQNLLQRRLQHEPIQYLVGQWDFLHHVFHIEPPLLCPRPETEELVLLAWQDLQQMMKQPRGLELQEAHHQPPKTIRILDVGCGTGCIGISLLAAAAAAAANSVASSAISPPIRCVEVVALDVEERAIPVSTQNAQRILGNSCSSSYQAVLSAAADYNVVDDYTGGFDLVISNPPYIPLTDMETLDNSVRNYESHEALFGGGVDGMNVIRDIVRKLPQWCQRRRHDSTGRGNDDDDAICWMEVDPSHPKLLQEWLAASSPSLGVEYVETKQDLQGKDRFVKIRVVNSSR